MACCTCWAMTTNMPPRPGKWPIWKYDSLKSWDFLTRMRDRVSSSPMSDPTLSNTGSWLKRITKSMAGEPRDLGELIEELRDASNRGLLGGDALVMLEGVLAVADMQVRDIMVPRAQMVFIERDEAPDKLLELVVESGHSRFPVIGEDRDQILGI